MSQQQEKRDNKDLNTLRDWRKLSKEVQKDFRKRKITKKDLKDAIAWARKNGRKR